MKTRAFFLFPFLSLLGASPSSAQSLSESVRSGLDSSPVIKEAIQQVQMAFSDVDIARAARKPKVSVQGSAGAAFRDRSIDGVATGSGDTLFSRSALLTVDQLLYDWGMTKHQIRSAELRQRFTELLSQSVKHEQAMEIVSVYLELMKSQRQLEVLDEQLAYLTTMMDKAKERAKAGVQGKTEVGVITGRLASAKGQRIQLSGKAKALTERFNVLTTLTASSLQMPKLPGSLAPYRNYEKNPRFQAAQIAIENSAVNVAAMKSDLLPKFYLNLSGGLGQDVLGITGPDNSYAALAVVKWDLFEGGKKKAAIAKAASEMNRDGAAKETVIRNFNDAFAVSDVTAQSERERMAELGASVVELMDVLGELEQLADSGTPDAKQRISLINLVQTQSEIVRNRLEGIDAEFGAAVATYRGLEASGSLLEYLNIE